MTLAQEIVASSVFPVTKILAIEKVLLASHQLSGPATDWWDGYVEAREDQLARI
jgi:hypothetical protein